MMCICCPSGVAYKLDMKAKPPHKTHTHMVESYICRHHVSKYFWTLVINKVLICVQENENPHELYAVVVNKGSLVVGHVPRNFSCLLTSLSTAYLPTIYSPFI